MTDYTVVVGTDGSSLAGSTVARAAWVAARDDADLVVVCAYAEMSRRTEAKNVTTLGGDPRIGQVLGRNAASDAIAAAVTVAQEGGATIAAALLVDGDPAAALLAQASSRGAQLLVVGARRDRWVAGRLLGTVATEVVKQATCDVLIVRPLPGDGDDPRVPEDAAGEAAGEAAGGQGATAPHRGSVEQLIDTGSQPCQDVSVAEIKQISDDARPSRRPGRRTRPAVLRALGLVALAAVWLALAGVGGQATGQLSSVQTNDQASFLPDDAGSTRAAELRLELSDSSALPGLLVIDDDGKALSEGALAAAGELAASLLDQPVEGYGGGKIVGDFLAQAPAGGPPAGAAGASGAVPVLPSEDGEAVLLALTFDADALQAKDAAGETALQPVADAVRAAGAEASSAGALDGARVLLTGPLGLTADLVSAFGAIDGVLLLVALGAVLVILVLVYRSPVLPLAVLLTSVFALSLAGLVIYRLADSGTLELSGQSQGILSILVVGAATDYGLLLVARYREELTRHASAWTALKAAWRAVLEPIAASAGTVIVGVLCLLLSSLGSNVSLGPVAAIGIAAALLAALTFLPVVLATGRWLFWPRIPRVHDASAAPHDAAVQHDGEMAVPALHASSLDAVTGRGLWPGVARAVGRHPRRAWVLSAAGLLVCAAFFPTFEADGTTQAETFLTTVDSVTGQEVLDEHFPSGTGDTAVVIGPADEAAQTLRVVRGTDGITGASAGVADARYAETVVTLAAAADSDAALETVRALRTDIAGADLGAVVGGASATQLDTLEAARADRALIIPVVLAVVLVILVALLRSVAAGVLLVACNLLSYAATIGVGALVFRYVLDFPGSDPAVPLFAFVFLVALGVDYSIFLMTRVREESLVRGTRPGVLVGLATTGGVITSAGVVLAATFAALGVVPLIFLAQLAFLVAFGVLLDTIVVRSLLLPGLAHDLGPKTWWPSRLSRDPQSGSPAQATDQDSEVASTS